MMKDVKFKCPDCGKEWVEKQDTDDDWFGLATDRTLCDECGKKFFQKWEQDAAYIRTDARGKWY